MYGCRRGDINEGWWKIARMYGGNGGRLGMYSERGWGFDWGQRQGLLLEVGVGRIMVGLGFGVGPEFGLWVKLVVWFV